MPSNSEKAADIAALLIDIEAELRRLNWWASRPPSPQAMASTAPFCADTLSLEQWLQFVFIPKMRQLIDKELALPGDCGIAPLAEVVWAERREVAATLIALVSAVDQRLGQ